MYSKRIQYAIDHFIMEQYFLPMSRQYHLREERESGVRRGKNLSSQKFGQAILRRWR